MAIVQLQGLNFRPDLLGSSTPNPMLLSAATDQALDVTAYTALNVPNMTPGQTYADPTTGVTIVKLTTASSPVASAGTYASAVDYGSGGCRIGRPTNGIYPIVIQTNVETTAQYHIITFNLATRAVGYRSTGPGDTRELCRAFSYVTPNLMFAISGGSTIRKYDVSGSSPSEITGGVWPKDMSGHLHGQSRFNWFQQTVDDRYFCLHAGDGGTWVVVWDSLNDIIYDHDFVSFDEPKMSKDSPFVWSTGHGVLWDVIADVERSVSNSSGKYTGHSDALRQYAFGFDGNRNPAGPWYIDLENTSPVLVEPDQTWYLDNLYTSGGWVDQASDLTQWMTLAYQMNQPPGTPSNEKMEPSGISLERLNVSGGLRLLCYTYGLGNVNDLGNGEYYRNSIWPNMSPDGKFCIFKSNMRSINTFASMFAAILPTN